MISNVELLSRLVLAGLLGSVIGFERERLNWATGLRTHMLVCVGSSMIMLVSAFGFADVLGHKDVVLDPSRIAAQVVSGIGFLGAGSILMRGEVIRGLTTAASLWSVAGIGLAVGGGMYTAAIGATIIILIILAGVKPLERRFISVKQQRGIQLLAERGSVSLDNVHFALGMSSVHVKQFIVQQSEDDPELDEVSIVLSRSTSSEFEAIARGSRRSQACANAGATSECRVVFDVGSNRIEKTASSRISGRSSKPSGASARIGVRSQRRTLINQRLFGTRQTRF